MNEYEWKKKQFCIFWKNISYNLPGFIPGTKGKPIIRDVNGYMRSGEITSIMGPSGSGKSTFLGCLFGSKKLTTGSVTILGNRNITMSYVQQDDYLLYQLKIREAMMYASKLKNINKDDFDHKKNIAKVMKQLGIEGCANLRPWWCSGGQKKRISIALELVSKPNVLILDEPTSGLDSVTTHQLIQTLYGLTQGKQPTAVICTIHQPSGPVFNIFHQTYILSHDGQCLYHGPPGELMAGLAEINLICPKYHNPADYVIEVATGDYSKIPILKLETQVRIQALEYPPDGKPVVKSRIKAPIKQTWILTKRSALMLATDPIMIFARVFYHVYALVSVFIIYGPDIGKPSGCPLDVLVRNGSFMDNLDDEISSMRDNMGCFLMTSLFIWFGSLFPVVLFFPLELNVFMKEYGNGWYNGLSYLLSKILSDIVLQLTLPNIMTVGLFYWTNQPEEEKRLAIFMIYYTLDAVASQALGLFIGAFFMDYGYSISAFMGSCCIFPLLLFSGFMFPWDNVNKFWDYFSFFDFVRFANEAAIVAMYGLDRCDEAGGGKSFNQTATYLLHTAIEEIPNKLYEQDLTYDLNPISAVMFLTVLTGATSEVTDSGNTESLAFQLMNLDEDDLWKNAIYMLGAWIGYQVLTYLVFLWKVNKKSS